MTAFLPLWTTLVGCGASTPEASGPLVDTDSLDTDGPDTESPDTESPDTESPDTDGPDTGSGSSDTGQTPSDTGQTPTLSARCDVQVDNPLRFDCIVDVEPAGPVHIELDSAAGPVTFSSEAIAERHALVLWGMWADTEHSWIARAESNPRVAFAGVTRTGVLEGAPDTRVSTHGPPQTEHVLFAHGCVNPESLYIADTEGRIVWTEDLTDIVPRGPMIRGQHITPDGRILILLDHEHVLELSLDGERRFHWRMDAGDFDQPVHHDVFRRADRTWTLNAQEGPWGPGLVVWDGFFVFEADGTIADRWTAEGALEPTDGNPCCSDFWRNYFPDAVDFAHTNALDVTRDHDVLLSYRYIDTIQKVVGDPDKANFGEVLWTLVGNPAITVPSDFQITSSAGLTTDLTFGSPHHVQTLPSGRVRLYDNGWAGEQTRVLEFELDLPTGIADIVSVVDLGRRCPIQGSAYDLVGGHMLVVCSSNSRISELDPATSAPVWELDLACTSGRARRAPYRALPIALHPDA